MKKFKEILNEEMLKRRVTEITAGILAILFIFSLLVQNEMGTAKPDKRIEKMEGWYYKEDGKKIIPELPRVLEKTDKGKFVMENIIPKIPYRNTTIAFHSQLQKVRVSIDGKEIYTYPDKKIRGGIVPSTWNFIRLPQESEGKHISIEVSSPYKQFQGKQNYIYWGSYNSLYYAIRETNFPKFLISLFIGIMGIVMVVISVFLRRFRGYRCEETLGILFILVSLWLCGVSEMVHKKIGVETIYFITMVSALFCNVFFLSYLEQRVEGKIQKITRIGFYLSFFNAVLCLILQVADAKDLIQNLGYILVSFIISFVYAIVIYGKKVLEKEAGYNKGEFVCMLIILGAGLVEWVHFYSKKWYTFGICIRGAVLIYTMYLFGYYIWENYNTARLNRKLSRRLQNSEIQLMMSQIQPHFIYNALGSIRTLIKISPDDAYKMVYDFSNYLRGNIDAIGNKKTILFSEEIRHIKSYVNIEEVRFKDQLKVVFDIREENFYIPPLSVQALVENAIKHGIRKKMGGGCVWIRSYKKDGNYIVEVEDNGVGFDVNEKRKENSTGLKNIEFRLEKMSHGKCELHSECGVGTKATLIFPQNLGGESKLKIVIIDDEWLQIKQFEMECAGIKGVDIVATFTNPLEAYEYIKEHPVEVVFTDIEMPEMDGIIFGKKVRELYPDIVLIFVTGYEQYLRDAFQMKADYYVLKPYNQEEIRDVLKRSYYLSKRQKKRIYFRTFGRFDVFVDGQVVYFANAKAKELLALCVDHRGGNVTMEEAVDKLWGERLYDERVKTLYRKAVMYLKKIFQAYDIDDVFVNNRGSCNINYEKVDCDYYAILEKKKSLTECVGQYLWEYSWAEETAVELENSGRSKL